MERDKKTCEETKNPVKRQKTLWRDKKILWRQSPVGKKR